MSKQQAGLKIPTWWPPKAGTKLRHVTQHGAGAGRVKRIEAFLHVQSIFKGKDGETLIVTAEWFPSKQCWSYEVRSVVEAARGSIWPDGTDKPRPSWS
jgi:hypothetical protein